MMLVFLSSALLKDVGPSKRPLATMPTNDTRVRRATVMRLDATLRAALPTMCRSWPGMIAGLLVKRVRGPRGPRCLRWHDSDGAHRGF